MVHPTSSCLSTRPLHVLDSLHFRFRSAKLTDWHAKNTAPFFMLRVYAQTSFYQENLAFYFQLCTVTHFVGFLLLPWFSCSLVFFPYRVYAQTSFYQKTWLSAFSYAQSHISLVFCCSLGFLVPWFSPLQLNKIWRIFCVMYGEEMGGLHLFVCKNYISLTCLNGFFAIFNFDNI
jgi:hypothetical protein